MCKVETFLWYRNKHSATHLSYSAGVHRVVTHMDSVFSVMSGVPLDTNLQK